MNINNLLNTQSTNTHAPIYVGQPPSQPEPDYLAFRAVAHHPQQSLQPPALTDNLNLQHPPQPSSEPSAYSDYGSQWPDQCQQNHYHVLSPVTQPHPHLAAQPICSPYQPITGYVLQPQLPHHILPPPQDLRLAKRQRFGPPNLNSEAHHHAPLPPRPHIQPSPLATQNTWVCHQRSSCGTRGFVSRNTGEIADTGRAGQSDDGVRAYGSGGGAVSVQAENWKALSTPAAVPVPTQFQGAHSVNISGNPRFTNIGMNTGNLTTVNNYNGTHGLERLEKCVSFAALHGSAEQDPNRRCHPGTRKNVLTQLRDWFDNPNSTDGIFWLHGPAGAGKSAITQTIADEYKKRGVAATFFFFRSDPSRNDANRLFTTIAWQLAFSIPPTKDFIIHALDETPHLPTQAVEPQFEQLVAFPFRPTNSITSQMSQLAPVVIIDGVDECADEKLQQRFLTVIGDAIKNRCVPLRFLIVSRPEAPIEETLNKFKDVIVSIDLAKLDDSNRDIRKYLKDKFSEIAFNRGSYPTWPGQEIIEEIVFKSSGNFIFAVVVIRFISDEDYDPEFLLNIVRNLTPHGSMSPFALLDELFLEILRRQRDQDFLKTFLALLLGRSSIRQDNLHRDDAKLMNVSEKDLNIKLRRMRSLLKFKPFIDVYHKSFLDFVHDPSRSGQYHLSKRGGLKRYLELIVDSVVRHVSIAIEQPSCHQRCRSSPEFKSIVERLPPKIVLPVEDWQKALKPLLDFQDTLLKNPKPQSCHITQVMRDLLLHLVFLQGKSHSVTASQALESNTNKTVTEWSPVLVTKAQQKALEKGLDSCLSALLSRLQKADSVKVVDAAIIENLFSLLMFDCAETLARVPTVSDARKLIDLIDLLSNNESFVTRCSADAACKMARLASEIFARVPHLPQSLFLNNPAFGRYLRRPKLVLFDLECQSAFISRILDQNYVVPVLGILDSTDEVTLCSGNKNEHNYHIYEWLRRSSPNLTTRIRVTLEVARTIRYIHSVDVVLSSAHIKPENFFLDSNLHVKFEFCGSFAWWSRDASIYDQKYASFTNYTYESNISAFAHLFREVCFNGHDEGLSNHLIRDAMELIERCRTEDPNSRPTMKEVVTEMETWNLT